MPTPANKSASFSSMHIIEPHHHGTVLVVEDYPVSREVICRMLHKMGLKVDIAENGRDAVECCAHYRYDMIFMDCLMPEMDGYTATRRIRKHEASGCHTPIVAITANAIGGEREQCLDAGMDEYLSKPIHAKDIDAMLYRFL